MATITSSIKIIENLTGTFTKITNKKNNFRMRLKIAVELLKICWANSKI